ncbi:MAG TPA: Lrp/AsnC family transcriptional regulator, partial [Methanomicrobiales archaeon]|nr:Lrp/AsnC family transcriptional regulator [Methanomicrobiales archaeon]
MDETDRTLLHLLEENCQIPLHDLAVMLGISDQEAEKRIENLQESRIIRKYAAVIDWERAGNGEVAAIIDLKVSPERNFGYDKIAERIARFKQVRSLHLVTGVYDLQLVVTGRSMHEVSRFVAEEIAPMDQIRETATHMIMRTFKENGLLFFEKEEGERIPFSP